MSRRDDQPPMRVRLPADVNRPDKIAFNLTVRQLAILSVAGLLIYAAWSSLATTVPAPVLVLGVLPVAAGAFLLAVVRRDGMSLDAWLLAAVRHRRQPHRLVPAEGDIRPAPAWVATTTGPGHRQPLPAPLRLPARGVTPDGLVDLGPDGSTALVTASTVAFGLRTPAEQNGLVAGFGRWLNSLDAPVQIVVRAHRVDLSTVADRIARDAAGLPHPALEDAARSHAAFLGELADGRELLHRRIVIAVRDKRSPGHAYQRAVDAVRALAGYEVTARVLDAPGAAAVLADGLDPAGIHPHGGDHR